MVSDQHAQQVIPRGILVGAAVVIGIAILLSGAARLTGIGTTHMPATAEVESRSLHFADQRDGSIAVTDAATGRSVAVVPPGSNGFLRGTLRGLARERKRQDIGPEPAFKLIRWADGRLTLEDPTTRRVVDLAAFGPTNSGVFADLLTGSFSSAGVMR